MNRLNDYPLIFNRLKDLSNKKQISCKKLMTICVRKCARKYEKKKYLVVTLKHENMLGNLIIKDYSENSNSYRVSFSSAAVWTVMNDVGSVGRLWMMLAVWDGYEWCGQCGTMWDGYKWCGTVWGGLWRYGDGGGGRGR